MKHFFEKRDRWGNSMALWVLVAMLFVLPPAWWSLRDIHLQNDVESWLPNDDPQARTLAWYRKLFSPDERIYVAWDGDSLFDPRVQLLARRLEGTVGTDGIRRNGLKQVADVTTPHELIARMQEEHIDRAEAIRRLQGVLIGLGKMRVRLTDAGRRQPNTVVRTLIKQGEAQVHASVEVTQDVAEWNRLYPVPDAAEMNSEDVDNRHTLPALALSTSGEPIEGPFDYDLEVSWPGIQLNSDAVRGFEQLALDLRGFVTEDAPDGERLVDACFFLPTSPVAISITLSEAGAEDRKGTFDAIRHEAAEIGIDPITLHLGGRPVIRTALNQGVKEAAWNTSVPAYQITGRSVLLSSCLVVAALAFWMLKSVRLATMVLAISVYSAVLAVALVPITGGGMNMVLVVMPPLLLTLTMSGAIHVANYWKHAAAKDSRTAIVESSKLAWQPCLLAGVTTAVGMASLMSSSLTPVRDFGMYSAVGCLMSVLVVLYGLPSILQFWPARPPLNSETKGKGWLLLGRIVTQHHILVTTCCALMFVGCAYGLRFFTTETKVIRYFSDRSRVVQDYRYLEEQLAGIVPVDTIISFDREMRKSSNFLERMEIVREVEGRIRQHPEISGALSFADFQPVTEPLPKDASFLRRARYNKKANSMEAKVKGDERANVRSLLVEASEPADLIAPGDHRLNKAGDELWRITAQAGILSEVNYGKLTQELDGITRSVLKFHAGSNHVVTGIVPVFLRTQQAILESLITSFALAFGVIALLMMIMLKSPLSGLLAMLPNLLPISMVFGILCWLGQPVDVGMMITASVALGIAVDGTLHLLTWFRSGIQAGMSRRDAINQALGHCGPAMSQTSIAISAGLLLLAPSDLLLISRFGWLMATLIASALLADIVFLPALLAGPMGHLIEGTLVPADPTTVESRGCGPPKPHLKGVVSSGSEVRIDTD